MDNTPDPKLIQTAASVPEELWDRLRLPRYHRSTPPIANANAVHDDSLSKIDRLAVKVTDKVGSVGFFLIILTWTLIWCGYNILATEVPSLHWPAFDPFPAFVAYLLMSNVIQILLMPLIMVGQNLQGRHSETRAQLDFEINMKAEKEILVIVRQQEHNTELLIQLMKHLDCRVSEEEIRALAAERELASKVTEIKASA